MDLSTPTKRIKRGWMNLRVGKIIRETPDCQTIVLVDNEEGGRSFDYEAGQYLTFRFDAIAPKPVVRSYTLSSSPNQPDFVAITVKETADGFISAYLTRDIKVGDVLRARGPIGKFCYHPGTDRKHLVMIAAGSGVSPFISIIREYADKLGQDNAPSAMTLLVGFRRQEDIICSDLLAGWRAIPGINIRISLSQEQAAKPNGFHKGRIDKAYLQQELAGDLSAMSFMTCGPEGLMNSVSEYLQERGVPMEHIHTESFAS